MVDNPEADTIREQLERIVRNEHFVRSKRLVRFLRYTVEKTLANSSDELTEYTIGTEVYDRPNKFDPLTDGIVRTEAHRLRAKLRQYYKSAGRGDQVLIEYPIGSYVPSFHYLPPDFLPDASVVAALIRTRDWSQTALGPIATWPRVLRSVFSTHLCSNFPAAIFWGPEFRLLFNDAMYKELGGHYIGELGEPISSSLESTIPQVASTVQRVFAECKNVSTEQSRWMVKRGQFEEERYYSQDFSPLLDHEGKPAGVLLLAHDVTNLALRDRRARMLLRLGSFLNNVRSEAEACQVTTSVLQANTYDMPFAALYLLDGAGQTAYLRGAGGSDLNAGSHVLSLQSAEAAVLRDAVQSRSVQILRKEEGILALPQGPWNIPLRELAVLPLITPPDFELSGFLIAGTNPHRTLDYEFRAFLEAVASRISALIVYGRLNEQTHRAQSAGSLDRDRTSIFKHALDEFRTPLTVLMGSLSELAGSSRLGDREKTELSVLWSQFLTVRKLVEDMADFERIRRNEFDPLFSPVDLPSLTAELAGIFRSAIEAANLRLVIDCPELDELAYVDRASWEKIVSHLILNALRYTVSGEIGVAIRKAGNRFELTVWDTGQGFAADELPQLLEPFHHPENDSQGGTLDLTLVDHLARTMGGRLHVESEFGVGSRFTVSIPRGLDHVPANRIASIAGMSPTSPINLRMLLEEAMLLIEKKASGTEVHHSRWSGHAAEVSKSGRKILIAIPNTELRNYCERVLGEIFSIESVFSHEAAISSLREQAFDILLADAALDGQQILRLTRSDRLVHPVAVILLSDHHSADELRTLVPGADDYFVTPFTAQELIVRVESRLALRDLQRKAEVRDREAQRALDLQTQVLGTVIDRMPAGVIIADAATGKFTVKNKRFFEMFGDIAAGLRTLADVRSDIGFRADGTPYAAEDCPIMRAARDGEVVVNEPIAYALPDGRKFTVLTNSYPVRDRDGRHVATVLSLHEVKESAVQRHERRAG